MSRRKTGQRPIPLRVTIGERFGRSVVAPSANHPHPLPTPPARSARDVVALLLAAAGLRVAARADAAVELLPGSPMTIVISVGGQARAAFILPVSDNEVARIVGARRVRPDRVADRLWEESRRAEMLLPDADLDARRSLLDA